MTLEERIAQLELKITALEAAFHIAFAAAQPAKTWLDANMERIDGQPRHHDEPPFPLSEPPEPSLPDPGQPEKWTHQRTGPHGLPPTL